jgi:hypothetical protein
MTIKTLHKIYSQDFTQRTLSKRRSRRKEGFFVRYLIVGTLRNTFGQQPLILLCELCILGDLCENS